MKKIKYYSILNSSNLSDYHFLFIQISESSIKRILGCKNNREKSSTTELGEETAYDYWIFTLCTFDDKNINIINTKESVVWKIFAKI